MAQSYPADLETHQYLVDPYYQRSQSGLLRRLLQ